MSLNVLGRRTVLAMIDALGHFSLCSPIYMLQNNLWHRCLVFSRNIKENAVNRRNNKENCLSRLRCTLHVIYLINHRTVSARIDRSTFYNVKQNLECANMIVLEKLREL